MLWKALCFHNTFALNMQMGSWGAHIALRIHGVAVREHDNKRHRWMRYLVSTKGHLQVGFVGEDPSELWLGPVTARARLVCFSF